jgi:hypothetical protein
VGLLNCCSVTIGPMGRVPIVVSQSVHVRYCWSRLLWRKFRSVFFLPDRILVLQGSMNADVDWSQVTTVFAQRRFIEGEGVAGDAEVVGQTWKYLKKGGPDQRFKDNRQLPICFLWRSNTQLAERFPSRVAVLQSQGGWKWVEALETMRVGVWGNRARNNGFTFGKPAPRPFLFRTRSQLRRCRRRIHVGRAKAP